MRGCDWCGEALTKRQKRCCSRSCTVRCQNRDRAREARRAKARAENIEFWLGPKG